MRFFRSLLLLLAVSSTGFALEIFIPRAYTSGEEAQATLYASGEGTIFMRVYRIDDVESYLSGQNNAHTAQGKNERLIQPGYFLWRSVVENMEYSLYQLARRYMRKDYRERLRADLGLEKYAFPFRDRFPESNLFAPLKFPIVNEFEKPVKARHWQALKHQFQKLTAGYYLVEVSQGRHIAHSPLIISDIAMVAKTSPQNALIYAVNLTTGEILSDASISAFSRRKDSFELRKTFALAGGVAYTDNVGYLKESENTLYVLKQGKHYAFSDLYQMDASRGGYESAIYTDRPVYRIGDMAHIRAVFIRKQGKAAQGNVKYAIKNSDNEILHSGEADLSPAGSLSFSYKTQNLKPGRFTITMEIQNEKHTGYFLIEQYKKPETRANMAAEKNVLLAGEVAQATLAAAYYSGEPLGKAKVEVVIERSRISYPWWYGLGYEEYYGDGYDYNSWDFVKDYTTELDAKGKLTLQVPTDAKVDGDFNYRVRATVKAQNREETMASARFKVYRAPVTLRLSQERWYFTQNTPIAFKVIASSIYDMKPVKASVMAELIYRTYDPKAQKYIDAVVEARTLDTNDAGELLAEFPAQKRGGTYLVKVSAAAAGKQTSELTETYVFSGSDYAGDYESTEKSVSVTANKKQYTMGDSAEFAIRMPSSKKLPVLITLENDRIRKHLLLKDSDPNFVYKEELRENLSPNFTLSVTALGFDKTPRYYSGSTEIILPPKHRLMKLEVVSDRGRYRPGEEANFIVKTFDASGKPVAAEFSLGVVDEAIYAIREDSLKSLGLELNPKLAQAVVTMNSLAFSFYGYGAEKSLYALYREQMTEAAALRKGESQKVKIRKNFKDTAFFTATGKTGADGLGRVKVELPDNLTEWRITTHAHSAAGLSQSERTKIVVAKDFALRLAQPRFLRERDEAKLRLLISNQLKEKQTANFEATLDALKLSQAFPKSLEIPAGEERYVDFSVSAPFYPKNGNATLRFIARSEKDSDGLELKLPILPYGVENFIAEQKVFEGDEENWKTNLKLDPDARSELAELQISFVPGVIPSILETLPYLIQFPYGCVEQTLSTFLPAIWASQAAKKLDLPLPVKPNELKDITDQGLKKLYGYQHSDGGWGWWTDDPTDIYMTAYTLWGLSEAERAGVKVDKAVLERGTKYLTEQLTLLSLKDLKDSYSIHRLIFAQGIGLGAAPKSAMKEKIRSEWSELLTRDFREPTGLAIIVEAASKAKFKDLLAESQARLTKLVKKNAQGTYFELADKKGYYWYNDREETTAQVLNALLNTKGSSKDINERDIVSYLIAQKKQRRWRSTKVSALVMRAFADYAVRTGEKLRKVRVTAEVDGERRDTSYEPKKSRAQDLLMTFKTTAREAKVKVSREGSGFFIARAEWKHYLNKPLIVPREGDFKMTRRFFAVNKYENKFSKGAPGYIFKAGDLVMTEIDLKANKGSEYLLLEDMIPAGFEPLNAAELADLGNIRYDNYMNSPSAVTRLDDRVGLAKTYMSEANFTPRSFYRAVFPGKYQVMPAQGGLMYFPETFAYSASDVVTIGD